MRDESAAPLLAPLPADERFASWHIMLADGSLDGHGTGMVELLRSMHFTRLAGLLDALPDDMLDTLYGFVARHRNQLGRLVPNGRAPRRFP